jgi:tetratricopeptide (TPR) repeat protein
MFEPLAADGFAALPRDEEWVFGLSLLAEVIDRLDDAPRSARLYELLAPFAGRNVLSVPDVAAGSVARTLGVLAAATGRWEAADAHFEEALAMNLRMGARPWAARTLHGRARMLVARGAPGDRARASEELRRAIDGYRALGMTAWAQRAAREPQPARIER